MLKRLFPFALLLASSAFAADTSLTPLSPGELVGFAISPSEVVLKWADSSRFETGYRIERSTDGQNYVFAGRADQNARRFKVSGLNGDTMYFFRVIAESPSGSSLPAERAVATAGYLTSHTQIDSTRGMQWPMLLKCRADGECAMIAAIEGEVTACNSVFTDTNVVMRLNPDKTCRWATEIKPDFWNSVAIAENGDVAVVGVRVVSTGPGNYHTNLVVSRFSGASGLLQWTKIKGGTNNDGSPQSWRGGIGAFALDSGDLYVTAAHDALARGQTLGYASVERYSPAGVNTQLANSTDVGLGDIAVRPDGTILALGSRSNETKGIFHRDMVVLRISGSKVSQTVYPAPSGATLEPWLLALDPIDNSFYAVAKQYDDVNDGIGKIFKFSANGALVAGFPVDHLNGLSHLDGGVAGVDSSRRLLVATDEELSTFSPNGELLSFTEFSSGARAISGDTMIVAKGVSTGTSELFGWREVMSPANGYGSLMFAGFSSTGVITDQTIAPSVQILSAKYDASRWWAPTVNVKFAASDDRPLDVSARIRYSVNNGMWSNATVLHGDLAIPVSSFEGMPSSIRIQIRDGYRNWSVTEEFVLDNRVRTDDGTTEAGAATPIDVAID